MVAAVTSPRSELEDPSPHVRTTREEVPTVGVTVTDTGEPAAAPVTAKATPAVAPIVMVTALVPPVAGLAEAPESARIVATPDALPVNVAVAIPLRVSVDEGDTSPISVMKRTVVPFCTGVPPAPAVAPASLTNAVSVV